MQKRYISSAHKVQSIAEKNRTTKTHYPTQILLPVRRSLQGMCESIHC